MQRQQRHQRRQQQIRADREAAERLEAELRVEDEQLQLQQVAAALGVHLATLMQEQQILMPGFGNRHDDVISAPGNQTRTTPQNNNASAPEHLSQSVGNEDIVMTDGEDWHAARATQAPGGRQQDDMIKTEDHDIKMEDCEASGQEVGSATEDHLDEEEWQRAQERPELFGGDEPTEDDLYGAPDHNLEAVTDANVQHRMNEDHDMEIDWVRPVVHRGETAPPDLEGGDRMSAEERLQARMRLEDLPF
ncbi:hypothetical protein LZ32DRAFT_299398 [Colletotrichum eremochloae]|nr:hypothetical protein LZ32DRAFT_299398 [Colletotrichum eremochloae]